MAESRFRYAGLRMSFSRFSWAVLGYNLLVILWGAFVRATGSGAGCGGTWPLCNGEVVPPSPTAAMAIEYTHRITSGLALASVAALWVWARRAFPSGARARKFAGLSAVFILVEAALGAGLVVFELTGTNSSGARAVYLAAHLANTQVLLAMLAGTVYFSAVRAGRSSAALRSLPWALAAALAVSMSGAIAALGDTVFPAASLAAGVRQDLHPASPLLLRLRTLHPAVAIVGALFILSVATKAARLKSGRAAWAVFVLVLAQVIAGGVNVALLAPVWMQIVHLFVANLLWLSLVWLYFGAPRWQKQPNLNR